MDRSIPHIRSIFSSSARKKSTSDTQDLCQEPSRSPRRKDLKVRKALVDFSSKNGDDQQHQLKKNTKNGNYNTYTSKTLTEKDMKHLERHLSMKKTIRKQISRNLAQAFILDGPGIFEPEADKASRTDHLVPLTDDLVKVEDSLKVAGTEQNVLELLKTSIDDRDSGHSSPTPEHQDEASDCDEEAEEVRHRWTASPSRHRHRGSDTKGLVEVKTSREFEKKSSSIWRMFSTRKGKRLVNSSAETVMVVHAGTAV